MVVHLGIDKLGRETDTAKNLAKLQDAVVYMASVCALLGGRFTWCSE